MIRPRMVSVLLLLGLAVAAQYAIQPHALAQSPSPSPAVSDFCQAASIDGGGTRVLGLVEIALPSGTYNILLPPPDPGEQNFVLCHKESGGTLNMNATNCEEISRDTPTGEAEGVIDAIVASCRIAPTPTPEAPAAACPEGEAVQGGGPVTIDETIRLILPEGQFVVVGDDGIVQLCHAEQGYSLALRLADCSRVDIAPPDATGEITAAIATSCSLLSGPAPTVAEAPLITISPPNTGDAGLVP